MPKPPAIDIEKLKAGDGGEWERAWEPLEKSARKAAWSYRECLGEMDEDDFIIKAITKAHNRITKFNSFKHLCNSVAVTTRNAIRDELDRRERVKHGGGVVQSLDKMQDEDPEGSPGPGDEQPRREIADAKQIKPDAAVNRVLLAELFEEAFAHVDNRYANVVWDLIVDDLKYEEVAKKRGIAIGSVGEYKNRGLDALRKHMPDRDSLLWWHKLKGTRNGQKTEQTADDYAITPHLPAAEGEGNSWRQGS